MNNLYEYKSQEKINRPQIKDKKKNKQTRFSEPNFFNINPVEEANQLKKIVLKNQFIVKKKPRLSQIPFQVSKQKGYASPQHLQKKYPQSHSFLSPNQTNRASLSTKNLRQLRNKKKTSPKNTVHIEEKINPQTKTRKFLESQKQTLDNIQRILTNHGFLKKTSSIQSSQDEKSFRKNIKNSKEQYKPSQILFQQTKSKFKNQTFLSTKNLKVTDLYQIKQLKQTVSTSSSYKNNRLLRIQDFIILKQLGKGKFGVVKMAIHKKTKLILSIKIVKKSTIRDQQFLQQFIREVKIQSFLNHSNIIKMYTIFDDKENIYLLQQLGYQGNLYQRLKKSKKFTQNQVKGITRSICQGVLQLHKNNIMHRDIKPQNIVLSFQMAKITDFGWSTIFKDSMRQTFCGTPLYISPQILVGNSYSQKVDLWSIGILTFEMLTGRIPYQIRSQRDLLKIIHCKVVYPPQLSKEAKSFLQCLLSKDPKQRKSITEILLHPFLENTI